MRTELVKRPGSMGGPLGAGVGEPEEGAVRELSLEVGLSAMASFTRSVAVLSDATVKIEIRGGANNRSSGLPYFFSPITAT